ncbi:hypothetical protein AAZX31_18G233100 [Glycine max]|uniref:Uncharacterized protein n=1 Tax=Glycine soja TaxID=3848 RepID=A0A445FWK1_GLYSO|nr:uncharacterized protein LOC114396441 isoform X2 [Glycine soja]KAH1156123.1 hypothetical protein GYH30_051081 [Glycine max]RZB53164.1 hypothetical protein D0Y65_049264 [Glycine soja]
MSSGNVKPEEEALEKENVGVPVPEISEPKEQKAGSNCKGIEQIPLSGENEEDVLVNITGSGSIISGGKAVEDASEDVTDATPCSSSSFGDTDSGLEDASASAFTNTEVESPMCDGDQSKTSLCRKNKTTTSHWRRFIHPVRWRCKWLELQVKKLNSVALKYDKELAAYDHRKQLEFSKFSIDDLNVKSVPIYDGIHTNKVMKRKKRKKAEESDLSSYVSNHSIFSYYENKNRGACIEDFRGDALRGNAEINIEELKFNDKLPSVDLEDNDKAIKDIIQRIEELQSQVGKLKTRIDNVVSENPGKFCSVTQLSMIGSSDGFNHSRHNSASFVGNDNTFPDRITSFIETTIKPQLEFLQENTKDEILIQNQAAKEELHDFESVRNQFVEKTKKSVEEQKPISAAQVSESVMDTENAVPTLKAGSTSNSNFRRITNRRRKKPGSKRWKRR